MTEWKTVAAANSRFGNSIKDYERKEGIIMTKIDIISGFLGAGKTTFIKKLLQEAIKGEQVVLIEN